MVLSTLLRKFRKNKRYHSLLYSIYFFSFYLGWVGFPPMGVVDITVPEGTLEYWLDKQHHLVLPATVLGMAGTATYTQFLRND